jgi:ribonuclease P/MRP protein subunit POP5
MVRVKRRYFVFQFHFHSNPTNIIKSSHIHTTFETMIARLYGDVGVARFTRNLSIIYYNPSTHTAIVRCLRDDKHMLQTAATFISRLTNDQTECSIQTLHVGGSIRQCKKYLVNYCVEQLLYMNSQSINENKTKISHNLFKSKKKKTNNPQQQFMDVDHDKQLALQKLLADSRIESNSIIVSKSDDDDFGKRKMNIE